MDFKDGISYDFIWFRVFRVQNLRLVLKRLSTFGSFASYAAFIFQIFFQRTNCLKKIDYQNQMAIIAQNLFN